MVQRINLKCLAAVLFACSATSGAFAAPAIGTALARGAFTIDSARVEQATVFEGSQVQTATAGLEINLSSGSRILLGPESKSSIHSDRLVLEHGQVQVAAAPAYAIEAGAIRIQASTPTSLARVAHQGQVVRVAALQGPLAVHNPRGVLLASLLPGDDLELTTDASPPSSVQLTGTVSKKNGAYLLLDDATRSTLELRGQDLSGFVGKRVQASGTLADAAPSASPQVVRVSTVTALSSHASHSTVIAGVLIASGTGAALGIGLTREEPKPSASR